MTRMRTALIVLLLAAVAAPPALALDLRHAPAADALLAGSSSPAPAAREAPRADRAADAGAAGDYLIRFDCPDGAANAPEAEQAGLTCPTYIKDQEDVFGQPVLVIDPVDPRKMAFSAMHGGQGLSMVPGQEPPSERSRHDPVHQPHTTFMTRDGGASWIDLPYYAPDGLQRRADEGARREIWGEDNAATLDADGRIYVAALYAYRDVEQGSAVGAVGEPGPLKHTASVWKGRGLERDMEYFSGYALLETGEGALNKADSLHLAYVPDTRQVVVLWRETAAEGAANATLPTEIVLHTSGTDANSIWEPRRTGIGPCDAVSSPLAIGSRLYVGCFAPSGNATDMRVHAIETTNWTVEQTGVVPLTVRQAILLSRDAGAHMVAIGAGVVDGAPRLEISYGEAGRSWSHPVDFADRVTLAATGDAPAPGPLLSARVTAAAFAPVSGNVHVVYLERYQVDEGAPAPGIYKAFASVQAGGSFQGLHELRMGLVSRSAFSPTLAGLGEGLYDDLHDSIAVWRDPDGRDREFLLVGDYGFVQFAEVVEENPLPPIPIPVASVPPVPLATAGSIPSLVGLPAGILAGTMVARTLAARRKSAVGAGME